MLTLNNIIVDDAGGCHGFAAQVPGVLHVACAASLAELRASFSATPATAERAAHAGCLEPRQAVGAGLVC